MFETLKEKITDKSAVIGVIGLGYVGLPLLKSVLISGFTTRGFDIDQQKLEQIEKGASYLEHMPIDSIKMAIETRKCSLSREFESVQYCDIIVLCLPTPLGNHQEPDLSFVISSLQGIMPYLRNGQAISLESTSYPGTTEEQLLPILVKNDFTMGENFFLLYSPEREDPGNIEFGFSTIPKIVSGISSNCVKVAELFYGSIVSETVSVSSTRCAEMTKILENTYRSVNIALVNELKVVADSMGVNIFEVIDAAATKPFGYQAFYPGPGLGGHCIPIDPFYLTWKAKEYGLNTKFIELAGEINTSMPNYVVGKISQGLNRDAKSVNGSTALVLGVAYKKNIGDVRESPSIEIIDQLIQLGAEVSYHDPYVEQIPKMRNYQIMLSSIKVDEDVISGFDICIIVTDHDCFDYNQLSLAQLVIDTRGRMDPLVHTNCILA